MKVIAIVHLITMKVKIDSQLLDKSAKKFKFNSESIVMWLLLKLFYLRMHIGTHFEFL